MVVSRKMLGFGADSREIIFETSFVQNKVVFIKHRVGVGPVGGKSSTGVVMGDWFCSFKLTGLGSAQTSKVFWTLDFQDLEGASYY